MNESIIDLSNATQLGLTIIFNGMIIALLFFWRVALKRAFYRDKWTATDWLSVGIAVGFFFNGVDWDYWAVTWFAVLFGLPQAETLLLYGPVSNVLFRQIPALYSIYCHLVAAKMMNESEDTQIDCWVFRLACFGCVIGVLLFIYKYYMF